MYPSEMEAKPFNPTSPHGDTREARLLKKSRGGGLRVVNAANYVKGEFIGLFVSSIKFLPQSALLAAPSNLQHHNPPQFILTLGLLKLDKQAPLSAAPGGHRVLRGCRLRVSLSSWIFQKFWMVTCNSGKSLCLGGELGRHGKGREGGRAWCQGLCGGLTEPEEPGTVPHSPRPALLSCVAHSGTAASLPGTTFRDFPHKYPTSAFPVILDLF